MEQKLTDILEVAKEILKPAGLKGMSVRAIAETAVQLNKNLSMSAEEFQAKLQPKLAANLKLKKMKPTFAAVKWDSGPRAGKPRQGWFRLRVEKTPQPGKTVIPPQPDKAFTGKAGEYAVMGELLFWKFNPSIMAVDDGIDIIASKENKYFHIQVKTALEQEGGRFSYTIKHSSFREHDSGTMYYVFVLRRGLRNEFVIIPSNYIRALISSGRISESQVLSVTISVDAKSVKYTLNGTDVGHFVADFGSIA